VARLRQDAALSATAIGALAPTSLPSSAATALARTRLAERQQQIESTQPERGAPVRRYKENQPVALTTRFAHWRTALSGLAALVALTIVVGTPTGQAAASQFLAQFRSQRFAAITVDTSRGQNPFAELEHIGTVKNSLAPDRSMEQVNSVAEASQRVGFSVKLPDQTAMPSGLGNTPTIRVSPSREVRFTFDRAKARSYFDQSGHPEVSLPDKYDGASMVVAVPAGILLEYRGTDNSKGLIVGQSSEIAVGVDGGVTLEELRDFLLELPNVPPETARQLRAIQDWRNTLPIPVPADQIKWQDTTIAGGPGLLLVDGSGLGSAAIWQRDGRVYGIAGAVSADELKRVANSLR
jgi:hypothetical protein